MMKRIAARLFVFLGLCLTLTALTANAQYEPTWESLDRRPTPQWFDDAKFGIFVVWGLYSVPAWAPSDQYAEWYWYRLQNKQGPTWKFHERTYGADFTYQDFVPQFTAEMFDPAQWAGLFKQSGAKYVVMTANYHDGFCLWPSPHSWNWNSVDIGPHRDLVGDLTEAVRDHGLKMGYYYSVYEWFHPDYKNNITRYVDEHFLPQVKDLVERYQPSILWADGEWEKTSDVWKTPELLAWLFNESSCRNEIAVNDRWGSDCRGHHGGFYTTEYGKHTKVDMTVHHKWEENRGMGSSYGYNRNENIADYNSATQLIHMLIEMVSQGGNLLLDVGPTADGRIPVLMQERLVQIGEWLDVNGEAIYGTTPWRELRDGENVRYTAKGDTVYAICLQWPGKTLVLEHPKPSARTVVTLLGDDHPLTVRLTDGKLIVDTPALSIDEAPCRHAYTFKLTNVE